MTRCLSDQALRRIHSEIHPVVPGFRRGRVAKHRIAAKDPVLSELGGNGVDILIRSSDHLDYPVLDPNQVAMTNPRDHYVVVEDIDNGPWMTSSGLFVSVYQVENDGTIVQEIPGDFAPEYDDYLGTGETPIGQGSDWARVLDYFNLDVAEIDRWKDEVLENLKTGRLVESRKADRAEDLNRWLSPRETPMDSAVVTVTLVSDDPGSPEWRAEITGGVGQEYAFTATATGETGHEALRNLADAWGREGFLE